MPIKPAFTSAPVGRPRGFDADIALRIAADLFWQHGYEATSLDALSHAMGLSRSSFYACFGSKHALLMAAVRRYADDRYAVLVERVAACDGPREAVRAMLALIANVQGGSRGCLFVNAVAELAPGDAELVAFAKVHTARVGELMTTTLCRLDCARGEASDRAGAMLALVMGITTLRKTGLRPAELEALLMQADHLIPSPVPRNRKPALTKH